jgi:hypothetical protein
LTRLTKATTLLYVSAACFVLSGILGAVLLDFEVSKKVPEYVLLLGVVLILCALWLLIIYGINTINIRRMQHNNNLHLDE